MYPDIAGRFRGNDTRRLPSPRNSLRSRTAIMLLTWGALAGAPNLITAAQDAASDVQVLHDLRYGGTERKRCTLDLALPRGADGSRRPTIVVIHGGGWIEGDKSSFASDEHGVPGNIVEFARLGFVAAAINYRLSSEAPFPAALEDCQDALRFLRVHAEQYHIDTGRIGAYGNSAGGHLALLLGLIEGSADGQSDKPRPALSSCIQAVVSDSGPLDLVRQYEQNQLRSVVERFMGGTPTGNRLAEYKRASPISYVSKRTPPLLLIYGVTDEQVDVQHADDFVSALGRAQRDDVTYVRLAAVGHCPHSLVRVPYLKTVVNEFFVRTLRAGEKP
jgi:acetyl esterase/lipase